MQVSGRAGRAEKSGNVIIQTRHPDNPLLQCLLEHGYHEFAQLLLSQRQQTQLPPYAHLALMRAEAYDKDNAIQLLNTVKQKIENFSSNTNILGPIPAPMQRKAGRYRAQLLFQARERKHMQHFLNQLIPQVN